MAKNTRHKPGRPAGDDNPGARTTPAAERERVAALLADPDAYRALDDAIRDGIAPGPRSDQRAQLYGLLVMCEAFEALEQKAGLAAGG